MPTAMYFGLAERLPDAQFRDVTATIDDVRLVSSEEELAYIRAASRIADIGMDVVLNTMDVGVSDTEIGGRTLEAMERALPAEVQGRGSYFIQQGTHSLNIHTMQREGSIAADQMIEVAIEYEIWHYLASVERAVLIGEVSESVERAYECMLRAFESSRDAVRPGRTCAEIYEIARNEFLQDGYDQINTGAGLARNIVERAGGRIPSGNLWSHNERVLEPGIVMTIEPCAYVPGVGTPRHCDMIVVTDDGREILSNVDQGVVRCGAARAAQR
jgi:Xaa-Pro aminopeptidase